MRLLTIRGAAVLGLPGLLLTFSGAAGASQALQTTGIHCVASTHLAPNAGTARPKSTPEPRCFATFAESVAFATGGTVKLDATTSQAEQLAALEAAIELRSAVSEVVDVIGDNSNNTVLGVDPPDVDVQRSVAPP